jgi:hypothetical protein
VKNIAEKLFEKKVAFKLIVSKDFLFEWYGPGFALCQLLISTPIQARRAVSWD